MENETWSKTVSGLQTCIRVKSKKIESNQDFRLDLIFRNTTGDPIRIFWINTQFFRGYQSHFYLLYDEEFKRLSNISPPHGYVVTEDDFHLIDPNSESTFKQSLYIDGEDIDGDVHGAMLIWVYKNDISRWQGGVMTLDGPTKKLFDGGDIPHIWLGEVDTTTKIDIINS